ncbi:GNAT family N-acetyltransferase [candidate division WOR-3 bacterium]|uniref:GNAT family N-acetyltransferase n=1 Tax=candidate division WOR-3 bacterium TaxID=2052148 RepID=A0A9D5QDW9_UNCW3|nr:GNAT family N-acetyltransferase [candidate division WOR-3 bacterium]MBD3364485.1 GNAT family N-acetyltransferase [candidate division WOR-3 bacterium]
MHIICEGEKTVLREVELGDVDDVVRWKKDKLVGRMALDPDTEVTLEGQKQDISKAVESDSQLYLIIQVKENGQPVGYVRINWMDVSRRFAWLRFALGEESARRKGYAKDALMALLSHLFSKGMHRIEAEVFEYNTASLKLLSSLGFRREGLKRKAHYDGDDYFNIVVFGLLSGELR